MHHYISYVLTRVSLSFFGTAFSPLAFPPPLDLPLAVLTTLVSAAEGGFWYVGRSNRPLGWAKTSDDSMPFSNFAAACRVGLEHRCILEVDLGKNDGLPPRKMPPRNGGLRKLCIYIYIYTYLGGRFNGGGCS